MFYVAELLNWRIQGSARADEFELQRRCRPRRLARYDAAELRKRLRRPS